METEAVLLPDKPVPAERKSPQTLVIYSAPKTGKTTQFAKLENNLILDLENGAQFVEGLKIKVDGLMHLYKIGEAIKAKGRPYKYVTLDTATKLEEWCEEDAKRLYKLTPMGKNFTGKSVLELPNGGGYLYLRQSMTNWLNYVATLSENLIISCHLKDKLINNKKGEEVSAKDVDLTGKIRNIVCANADAIGYMYRGSSGELRINFTSAAEVVCGARPEHLRGQDMEFNWDNIYID